MMKNSSATQSMKGASGEGEAHQDPPFEGDNKLLKGICLFIDQDQNA
jgi:hypothetical protein